MATKPVLQLSWDQVMAFHLQRQFLDVCAPPASVSEVASTLWG